MYNKFTPAQRKCIVTTYYKNCQNLEKTRNKLRDSFKSNRLPSRKTIQQIVRKYKDIGSFPDLEDPPAHNHVGRCSENINIVYKILAENPNISRQQLVQETGIPKTTLQRILKLDLKIELGNFRQEEAKTAYEYKNAVLESLFKAFEKQQYYSIIDLVKITKKPIAYLKDILTEVCDYDISEPNKNMWHLKREYGYYTSEGDGASAKGSESQVVTLSDDCLVKIEKVWSLADVC